MALITQRHYNTIQNGQTTKSVLHTFHLEIFNLQDNKI